MQFDHLTTAVFSEALELVEERQALEIQLAKVNADLASLQGGKASKLPVEKAVAPSKPRQVRVKSPKAAPAPAPVSAPASLPKAPKVGKMKDRVLAILKSAGANGMAVGDLAATLQVAPANLHVWFATTGKKDPSIQKVGRGLYAWNETPEVPAVSKPVEVVEVPPTPAAPLPEETPIAEVSEPAPVEETPAPAAPESSVDAPVEPEPLLPVEEKQDVAPAAETIKQQELISATPQEPSAANPVWPGLAR